MACLYGCKVLCLPDCVSKHNCHEAGMWHGEGESITATLDLPGTVVLPERTGAQPMVLDGLKPLQSTTCIDGSMLGHKETQGKGWPYCFWRDDGWPFDWVQAKADAALFVAGRYEPLADDELVIHLRTGDMMVQAGETYKTMAAQEKPEVWNAPCMVQPGCKAYLDAALHGYNEGPFKKVHLMADTRCAPEALKNATSEPDLRSTKSICGLESGNNKEAATNPCIRYLLQHLPRTMVQTRPSNLSNQGAFKYDIQLMICTQNMAVACSTMSIFGRLTAMHLNRLFAPNCNMRHIFNNPLDPHFYHRCYSVRI